jgi:DNA-binding GntR family transcriptional regulator
MSDKALDEVAEVRKNLEPLAMKLIVERAQESEIKALLPLIREMKETVENDIPAFLVHEHKFTVSLLKLSDTQRLIKIISELIDQTRLKIVETKIKIKPLSLVIENHEAILAALLERDAERASALRLKHVEDIRGFWR